MAGPERLVPSDELAMTLDPLTGRSIDPASIGFLPERPGHMDVHEANGDLAWTLDVATLVSAAWLSDGRLLITEADRYADPSWTEAVIIEADGTRGPTLFRTAEVTATAIASVFGDYALLVVVAEDDAEQVVVVCAVRVSDGAVSALRMTASEVMNLQLGGWLPEASR
jgi:hypothetical protein